ncbi:MAG: thymidine phosphorylase, partial [Candidatus Komeilibacteria bacterium]|nr:thymidine phosphorylase [Candidatus Komeilibacteria bacterium]
MALFLKFKKLDIETGSNKYIVVLNEKEAENQSIFPGDKITLQWRGQKKVVVEVNLSDNLVRPGQIGIYEDIWKKFALANQEIAEIHLLGKLSSIQAIKKRIYGSALSKEEMNLIIEDVVAGRLDSVPISFFIASSFVLPYSEDELFYLTRAMVVNGDTLKFPKGKVIADLHSVGGVAGNRTTLVVVPIVAALGLTIPKTFSRAITQPSGTGDTMEVLAPVTFTTQEMKKIVDKIGACLVWGGGVNLAPADDHIIKVTFRLSLEVYDKMIASIMAKKAAAGITHLILYMPVGLTTKIPNLKVAAKLKGKFER